jgi:hypothetical protein
VFDVVVDNPPDLVWKGQDSQLEKAVEMLREQIKANPKKLPARPSDLPTYPEGPGLQVAGLRVAMRWRSPATRSDRSPVLRWIR